MNSSIIRNKDFVGGALLMCVGAGAAYISRGYPFGSARQMGPGFTPTVLSLILIGLGILLAARAGRVGQQMEGGGTSRPIFVVLGAVLLFSQTLQPLGLVFAALLLVLVTCFAHSPVKLREALILSCALTAGVVLLFAYALGIPFKLWPWSA
jgi:hypothetical protein